MTEQHIALGLLVHATGSHPAAWLKSSAPTGAAMNIDYYRELAALAESGLMDLFSSPIPLRRAQRSWTSILVIRIS